MKTKSRNPWWRKIADKENEATAKTLTDNLNKIFKGMRVVQPTQKPKKPYTWNPKTCAVTSADGQIIGFAGSKFMKVALKFARDQVS